MSNPVISNYINELVEVDENIRQITGIPIKNHIPFNQITSNLDNVSNQEITDGGLDIANPKIFHFTIEAKCVNGAGTPGDSKKLTIFYAFSYEDDCDIETDDILSQSESSFPVNLTNTGNGAINRNISDLIIPKARYLYLWYDVDDLTTPLASLDVVLNIL